ncbi:MAG: hypothetical protein GWP05_01200 [Anaerolineaceae bacterium]|nr:hypothetical protein [Anaerolineaceae bacterium]
MKRHPAGVAVNILATLLLLEIAAVAALAGYLILTERVTEDKVRLARQVFDGEVTDATIAEAGQWHQHLQEVALREKSEISASAAVEKLAMTRMEAEAKWLGLQWQLKRLQDREALLQRKMDQLEQKRKSIEEIERRIDEKTKRMETASGSENFQKMARILSNMKPPELKKILEQLDDGTVVAFLKMLEPRKASKLMAEFKTQQEMETRRRWLEMLRTGQVASISTKAGG